MKVWLVWVIVCACLLTATALFIPACAEEHTEPAGSAGGAAGSVSVDKTSLIVCGAPQLVAEVQHRFNDSVYCRNTGPRTWSCENDTGVWSVIAGRTGLQRANTFAADVAWCPDGHGPCYWWYSEACDCSHCWGIAH